VDAWVVRDRRRITVLLVNRAFPGHPIQRETVNVRLHGTAQPVVAWMERIDHDHCNPRRLWEKLGSSPYPDPAELEALHAASELRREVIAVQDAHDGVTFNLDVPPDGIASVTLEFAV